MPPQTTQPPKAQACSAVHCWQLWPPLPHAVTRFPASQPVASQQPGEQLAAVQPQPPSRQISPEPHVLLPQHTSPTAPQTMPEVLPPDDEDELARLVVPVLVPEALAAEVPEAVPEAQAPATHA